MTQEDIDFNKAYDKWFPLIKRKTSVWRMYMSKEEANQVACIALWKSMKHYQEGRAKFITYLIHYLNWEFMNSQKEKRKNAHVCLVDPLSLGEWESLSVEDDEQVFLDEQVNILKKYLDPKHVDVLNFVLDGRVPVEIATLKKVSKQRIHQMREHIKSVACDLRRRGQIQI